MNIRAWIITLLGISLFTAGRRQREKGYGYQKAYVDTTLAIHWYSRFFRQRLYLIYVVDGDTQRIVHTPKQLFQIYTFQYKQGDSVWVKYDSLDVSDVKVLGKVEK